MLDRLYEAMDRLPDWLLAVISLVIGTLLGAALLTLGLNVAAYVLLHA